MTSSTILRHLDPGEAFFFMADTISSMNFVVFAERTGPLDVEAIRAGLSVIQQENPLLRVCIVWNESDGLCFASAPQADIPLACHEVDTANWQEQIEAELSRPFATDTGPLLRCLYLNFGTSGRSVLALCFHHAIGDGRSGTVLLQRLLQCTAVPPQAGTTKATPLPPMYEVFPPQFRWAEQEATAEQLMDALMADYKRNGRLATAPWLASKVAERQPRFIRRRLPAPQTLALLARCRAEGTTLHGALCAAQLIAEHGLRTDPAPVALFLSCPVDMRQHLAPPQPATPGGLYVSLLSGSFVVGNDTALWDLAREIVAHTRIQLERGEGHLFFSMYGLEEQPVTPSRMPHFAKALLSSWQNTMVSNVGRIADTPDDPAVEAISFALCPMPYQTVFNAVSTYQDSLILNIGYDAAKLDTSIAGAFASNLCEKLLTAVEN